MRTVTLELLRHGPAHNQLLSPLTPYLALCENHAPVTLNVPFEHNQFLHRLTALTYEFGMTQLADNQRKFQVSDTGRELSRLLSAIPGLTAELNRHAEQTSEVIHLRLVLSASELALLPFELVLAGNGFPGYGQPLLLQNQAPICLTREVRRVKDTVLTWTPQARILVICASPPGLQPVPTEAHLLALRRAIDPWVGYFDEHDEEQRRLQVGKCLQVLPVATIGAIQDACAQGDFSHVHILAHGIARHDGFDLRFGIALHDEADPDGPPDVVSGDRLASALRPLSRPGRDSFVRPLVVTLASCNGANGGSVVGAGASVAHALQEAGIPLVVAGQFPLTFNGSIELVQTLYEGLLWGADPRALLMDLRRRMHVLEPRSHDWAALTAYASLPSDFDDQLCSLAIARARSALETAMEQADRVLANATQGPSGVPADGDDAALGRAMARARARVAKPWAVMSALAERMPQRSFELLGLLASLCKRRAEIELAVSMMVQLTEAGNAQVRGDCNALLAESRDDYWRCFRLRPDASWAVVQYLSLALLLDPDLAPSADASPGRLLEDRRREFRRLWTLAWGLSENDIREGGARAGWGLGNLIELPLLATLLDISPVPSEAPPKPWAEHAADAVDDLLHLGADYDFQRYSTRRQLERYAYWFNYVNPRFAAAASTATDLLQRFPAKG
jgi:hypothetical protein